MMDYELFKKIVAERILDYLPPIFSEAEVRIEKVSKVNEDKEAMLVLLKGDDMYYASPTIYLEDVYSSFCEYEDLDGILIEIAYIIMKFTGQIPRSMMEIDFKSKKDSIVMNLINKEKNASLLEKVPHKAIMDLAIVYRIVMSFDDTGVNTVLITNDLMNELDVTVEELNELAINNTDRIFPVEICKISKEFYIMTNIHKIHGATTMVYDDALEQLASLIKEDFYILPTSIHEVMAIPFSAGDKSKLVNMLAEGNCKITEECEVLSNSVYYYSQKDKGITIAASYN